MTVAELKDKLGLEAVTPVFGAEVEGAFVSDMVSDVMGGAKPGNVWVTVQTHKNIVAAANLVDVSAIVVTRGKNIPEDTIEMAKKVQLTVMSTKMDAFELAIKMAEVGIKPY